MKKIQSRLLILLTCSLILQTCNAHSDSPIQNNSANKPDREPAAAGRFYPASATELNNMLSNFFAHADKADISNPLAIIVPHAGYVFSGEVAANAFKLLDREKQYKHIFLIGSSHTMYFNGASIYSDGNFKTPLGTVKIDELANKLINENSFITNDSKPHLTEHSLEVQVPFLQYWLIKSFTIIPIIIGGDSESNCKKLAGVLAPYLSEDNLFVVSTDFSHYPAYDDAVRSDRNMADAIVSNSTANFLKVKSKCENGNTRGLVTAMCGWTSVYTLLNITEKLDNVEYQKIIYRNSGDSPYGEIDRVVGYYAIALVKNTGNSNTANFQLNDSDKTNLLKLARNTITEYLTNRTYTQPSEDSMPENLLVQAGAFVTLTKEGMLRGCIGNFSSEKPLYQTVQEMAIAAATRDPRFPPLTIQELSDAEVEISVLTPLHKIASIDEFELGKHGIYIRKGYQSGTFLPQVATGTKWTKEEFLGHCARDKAGIGWEGWKDAELYTYEALVFHEHEYLK